MRGLRESPRILRPPGARAPKPFRPPTKPPTSAGATSCATRPRSQSPSSGTYARRRAVQPVERAVGHRETGGVVEVRLIERERPVCVQVHQLAIDQVHVLRLAIGRKTHHLILA